MIVLQAVSVLIIAFAPLVLALSNHKRLQAEDDYWTMKKFVWRRERDLDNEREMLSR